MKIDSAQNRVTKEKNRNSNLCVYLQMYTNVIRFLQSFEVDGFSKQSKWKKT